MEIAAVKKRYFIIVLFIAACFLPGACALTKKISERINEKSFKDKAEAQFKEDFPACEVTYIAIRNTNQRERRALILYRKPGVKGVFTTEWKYFDRDENADDAKEDWQPVEKGSESEIRIKED